MVDLTNLEEIKKLDPGNVYGSTYMLSDQCLSIWELVKKTDIPLEFKNKKNSVICAMGGSMYGAYVLRALFHQSLKIPVISIGDYSLPEFANKDSLIIVSSYSGETEEPLHCAEEAIEKNLPLLILTNGGKALEISQKSNTPAIVFDAKYNPSGQPRLGMGYIVFGTLGIFNKLGFISLSDEQIKKSIELIVGRRNDIENDARIIAQEIYGYIPLIMAAQHLNGNIHIMRNQINETAKSFSAYSELPELNHHLLEGFKNPPDKKLKVLFISSALYSEKLSKRLALTKDIAIKNNVNWVEFKPQGGDKVSQVLEVLSFGAYLSFYLAILYGQDPSLIPWVDYFKEQLSK